MPPLDDERAAAPLIAGLARNLARFRTTRRGGALHIGHDMALCGFNADPRFARPCSPRCAEVAALLAQAAAYLGCEVADLAAPPKRARPLRRRPPTD